MAVVLDRVRHSRVRHVSPRWRDPGRRLGVGSQPRRHTGPLTAAPESWRGKIVTATVEPVGTVAADNNSPANRRGHNETAEESRSKQPGHAAHCDYIPGERIGRPAAQPVVRPPEPPGKKPERALADDDQNK